MSTSTSYAKYSGLGSAGSGTVTSLSIVTANGFAGTVATPTTIPAITLTTTVTGILKGSGSAMVAATAGTDYSVGTSALATGILKSTTVTGVLSIAVAADFPTLNQNTSGNAATVTTNANLTGPITSSGNATAIGAQTGTGSTFVMSASPTITGQLGLLSAASASAIVGLSGTSPLSGTAQRGFDSSFTSTSAGTSSVVGFRSGITTAASTTVANVYGFNAALPVVGASGVITRYTDFLAVGAVGHLATNNAALADTNNYTGGSWFLNQAGTDPSLLGGSINSAVAQTTLTGSAGTAICSQPLQGSSWKKVVIYLNGYTDTGSQTYTFPTAFLHVPALYGLAGGVSGATVTAATIKFTTTLLSGFVIAEGF